jgi:hypothetical protein
MVAQKAPPGVPVDAFNAHLSKFYKAADYLIALNGKKAPTTIGQDVARFGAKYGGAATGAAMGGGVVSAFAGYSIGKALEHALENMSKPVRDTFLHNLETTNPPAFKRVKEYLDAASSGNTGTPRLEAPKVIYAGAYKAPVSESGVRSVAAKKGPVGVDKKSGQFKSTFQSVPE